MSPKFLTCPALGARPTSWSHGLTLAFLGVLAPEEGAGRLPSSWARGIVGSRSRGPRGSSGWEQDRHALLQVTGAGVRHDAPAPSQTWVVSWSHCRLSQPFRAVFSKSGTVTPSLSLGPGPHPPEQKLRVRKGLHVFLSIHTSWGLGQRFMGRRKLS